MMSFFMVLVFKERSFACSRENLPCGELGETKGKGGESPSLHKRSAEDWGNPCAASGAAPLSQRRYRVKSASCVCAHHKQATGHPSECLGARRLIVHCPAKTGRCGVSPQNGVHPRLRLGSGERLLPSSLKRMNCHLDQRVFKELIPKFFFCYCLIGEFGKDFRVTFSKKVCPQELEDQSCAAIAWLALNV